MSGCVLGGLSICDRFCASLVDFAMLRTPNIYFVSSKSGGGGHNTNALLLLLVVVVVDFFLYYCRHKPNQTKSCYYYDLTPCHSMSQHDVTSVTA
jgi:hypothetical protein